MSYFNYLPEAIILTSIFVMYVLGGIHRRALQRI